MEKANLVWSDRRRIIFGLPWSFTKYMLTEEKLLVETGFLNKQEEEIRLFRILDISLRRSFGERMFGLGTIHCCTADKTAPELTLRRIKRPREIKERLSEMVERERNQKRVVGREFLNSPDEMDHDHL